MRKKKVHYLLFFLMLIWPKIKVFSNENYVMFWLKNGQQVIYSLTQHPKIHYSDNDVILVTDEMQIEYPQGKLNRITFENDSVANYVEEFVEELKTSVSVRCNQIYLTGFIPNSNVLLCSINGQQIDSYKINNQGNLLINMDKYHKGIYIVKLNKSSIKILRK